MLVPDWVQYLVFAKQTFKYLLPEVTKKIIKIQMEYL